MLCLHRSPDQERALSNSSQGQPRHAGYPLRKVQNVNSSLPSTARLDSMARDFLASGNGLLLLVHILKDRYKAKCGGYLNGKERGPATPQSSVRSDFSYASSDSGDVDQNQYSDYGQWREQRWQWRSTGLLHARHWLEDVSLEAVLYYPRQPRRDVPVSRTPARSKP